MAGLHRASRAYGTAAVVVPGVGIALAQRSQAFDEAWVLAAIGLVAVGGALLHAGHLPAQRAALAADGGVADRPLLVRLRATAGTFALTWVVVVWLMVAKPR